MAHLQLRGKRISGQTHNIAIDKSAEVEIWGPYKSNNKQYKLVSSDAMAVLVELGAYVQARNAQVYKLTAKTFSVRVKLELVDGDFLDPAGALETRNLKRPYAACDFMFVSVQPNPGRVPWADYFAEVIPAIASGLVSYNATAPAKVIDKGGFFLVQTFNEQSPGATGKPSQHGNRMFNVQALVTRDASNRITGIAAGQEEPGVSIKSLSQGEGVTVKERVMLLSPTFYYDTGERAVTHYMKILELRYPRAFAIVTDSGGTFSKFARALKSHGYATHEAYAEDLINSSKRILHEGKAWVDYELKALDHDIAVSDDEVQQKALRAQRDFLIDFERQLANFHL